MSGETPAAIRDCSRVSPVVAMPVVAGSSFTW